MVVRLEDQKATTSPLQRQAQFIMLILCLVLVNLGTNNIAVSPSSNTTKTVAYAPWSESSVSSILSYDPLILAAEYSSQKQLACQSEDHPYIYVYDDLPPEHSTDVEHGVWNSTGNGPMQENAATEMALVRLFRSSPCRTRDANTADIFVVPYMHFSDCMITEGYAVHCGQVPNDRIIHLLESLEHYNTSTKDRHLFISIYDDFMSKAGIIQHPLRLTSGARTPQNNEGIIIVSIFHDKPCYQPSVLLSRDPSWWIRPRNYSFVAIYGFEMNPRMNPYATQGRRFRKYFKDHVEAKYSDQAPSLSSFVGRPFVMGEWGVGAGGGPFSLYQNTVFCPILPGDNAWMRRFYDVIRNGCLPVLLAWPTPDNFSTSWYTPNNPIAVEDAYPGGVDYDSFVVSALGNTSNELDMTPMFDAMESVFNNPQELHRRQQNMMRLVTKFTFGLGPDAHRFDDAFSLVMVELKKYMHSYSARMQLIVDGTF